MNLDYYLVDSNSKGRIKVSSSVLPVEAMKIPVEMIDASTKIEDLKNSGVYILIGDGHLYVGQTAERANNTSFISRWREHLKKKKWIAEALAFYSSSKTGFTTTDLKWLEREMAKLLSKAKGYKLENGNSPSVDKNLPDNKKTNLSVILEGIKLLTEVLGYHFFTETESIRLDGSEFSFRGAYLVIRDGKFIVKAGSVLSPVANEKYQGMRNRPEIQGLNVIEDIVFDKPSPAAELVAGSAINGWNAWKKDRVSLDELER